MLASSYRLRDSQRISQILVGVTPISLQNFLLFADKGPQTSPRFAFIASKKVGKSVERHRAVRVLREAVFHNLSLVQENTDVVIVARHSILNAKTEDVIKEMQHVLQSLNSRALQGSVE